MEINKNILIVDDVKNRDGDRLLEFLTSIKNGRRPYLMREAV
jgi:hypothetical protein